MNAQDKDLTLSSEDEEDAALETYSLSVQTRNRDALDDDPDYEVPLSELSGAGKLSWSPPKRSGDMSDDDPDYDVPLAELAAAGKLLQTLLSFQQNRFQLFFRL